ncbi:MAG: glycosyltransferase family 4 protein [Hyphomicrobiaceae bacterium]
MRVTIVDSDVSWPPTSGKRLRTLKLMLPLAREHQITYIGRGGRQGGANEAKAFFADHGITPIIVNEPMVVNAGPKFYGRLAANLADPFPYSVRTHITPGMLEAVQASLALNPPDLCQIEWVAYGYTLGAYRGPAVLQAHNVESLIWKRFAEAEANPLKRAFMRNQWRKFVRYEGEAFRRYDRVTVVSEADRDLARTLYGELPFDIVENGVDINYYKDVERRPDGRTILFVGSLDWRPNQDAVAVLLDSLFPAIRRLAPDARLIIVGRNPPAGLAERVAAVEGVELAADVPDVRPYLARSAVLSVPLRIGGGSRLKILEALAANVPVVSTAVGAEGLELEPGRQIDIADSVESQAAALAAILREPERAGAMASAGRRAVENRYDWSSIAATLEKVWLGAASRVNQCQKKRLFN